MATVQDPHNGELELPLCLGCLKSLSGEQYYSLVE